MPLEKQNKTKTLNKTARAEKRGKITISYMKKSQSRNSKHFPNNNCLHINGLNTTMKGHKMTE
jgi:hypothetical protein